MELDEFADLVRDSQASLRTFIRMSGVPADAVDDIAQEAFLIAFKRMERFTPGTGFGRWVRTIARNIIANERRTERRRSRILHDHVVSALAEDEIENADILDRRELVSALRECVDGLPRKSREILQKRYEHDENSTVLSRSLQMTATSLRKLLMKVRSSLQSCIEGKLGEVEL